MPSNPKGTLRPKPVLSRPNRRKPLKIYDEAINFLVLGLKFMEQEKIPLNISTVDNLKVYFRRYCVNNNIRGKHKDSMWRIVHAQIVDAKTKMKSNERIVA